jgi:glycerol-3-phosphate cytidylyltransferase
MASEQCDKLIVGLHTDPSIDRPEKNRPVQTTLERYIQLTSLPFVKQVIPYDTENDLENLLSVWKLDKRFIGSDYIDTDITGEEMCYQRNIEIVFIPRLHAWSSSGLRHRMNEGV